MNTDESDRPLDLQREEVRGVFVIGIIATLLAIRLAILSAEPTVFLLDVLIAYWGLYAGLMAIGVSSDILGNGEESMLTKCAQEIGHLCFTYGAAATALVPVLMVVDYLTPYLPTWITAYLPKPAVAYYAGMIYLGLWIFVAGPILLVVWAEEGLPSRDEVVSGLKIFTKFFLVNLPLLLIGIRFIMSR